MSSLTGTGKLCIEARVQSTVYITRRKDESAYVTKSKKGGGSPPPHPNRLTNFYATWLPEPSTLIGPGNTSWLPLL